jgi:hypothetical protein
MNGAELIEIGEALSSLHLPFDDAHFGTLRKITDVAASLAKSWSGSNIDYHADVYYADLEQRPPNAQFSSEWGIEEHWPIRETTGNWEVFSRDAVIAEIYRRSGNPKIAKLRSDASELASEFEKLKADLLSNLTVARIEHEDQF